MTRAESPKSEPSVPTVVYVAGCGRSGSTVVDIVLGNCERTASVGELSNLARAGWIGGEPCACGEAGNRCRFWCSVREVWERNTGSTAVELDSLQQFFCRGRFRPWFRLKSRNSEIVRKKERLCALTRALYRAISTVTGAEIVVDSSKLPVRASLLAGDEALDVRLIHLVRDARGVALSLSRSLQKNVAAGVQHDIGSRRISRTSLWWLLTNWQTGRVLKAVPESRRALVRYEDFASNPRAVVEDLGRAIDINFEISATVGDEFDVGHNIAGNRARMTRSVSIRFDESWRQGLEPWKQRLVWLICGRRLRALGYSKR